MLQKETIWLSAPHLTGEEQKYLQDAFDRGHVFPMGPQVAGLEQTLSRYTGAPCSTCLSSGTAALHLALILLGVQEGDEVICSSFTFSASANPIAYQKATPVFVDSEASTWNMDPELLEKAITGRIAATGRPPKAIILVHLYGMPARLEEILPVARSFDIPVIEDAAEALGATYQGRHCGTFGEIGIYSFNGNKIITTSGGGALVSGNPEYCSRAVFLATQARDPAPHYQHSQIGYNYRMSNICAAIGRGQMEVIDQRIAKRREHFFYYRDQLADIRAIQFLTEPTPDFFSNHWLSTMTIDPASGITPEALRQHLEKHRIETRPLWKPMHRQPVFEHCPAYINGISEDLFNRGLCLPSSSNLSESDRELVVEEIRKMFNC
jgi:dTDP-4-amino-4,6-dideoxygalactose transaminase